MLRLIKLALWIILISGGIFWWQYKSFSNSNLNIGPTTLEIAAGGFQLALIDAQANPILAKIYLSLNPPDFTLQKGRYNIPSNPSVSEFIEALRTPMNEIDQSITFLEGWNIYDIDNCLSNPEKTIFIDKKDGKEKGCINKMEKGVLIPIKTPLISAGDFVDFVTNCESFCPLKAEYTFISDAQTLEGFLYPDTYAVNPNSFTIENLTRKMLSNFQTKVIDSGILGDIGSIEILDIINMASIIQKEANKRDNPEELALIAGILKKRAEEGWQIGADATVCYAHQIATQDCSPSEVLKYLYDKNDYNTRQMVGLPAGPIANPEAEIIEATIQSQDSAYYYYLHDTEGKIHYGVSNADHEANKQKYLY